MTNQAALGVGSRLALSAATQVSDPGLIARILVLAGRLLLRYDGEGGAGEVPASPEPPEPRLSRGR